MSTLLENTLDLNTHGDELRSTMAAVRVSMKWLGTRKSVSSIQKTEAARPFNAEGKFLSVGKKLVDTTHPAWKAVTSVRSNILRYWRDRSLPFPEDGIRLIKRLDIDTFNETMRVYQNDLDEATWRLNEHYDELKASARRRLGRLYQESDYPPTLIGMFEVTWDYPNVEPPSVARWTAVAFGHNDPRVVASLGCWRFMVYRRIPASSTSGFAATERQLQPGCSGLPLLPMANRKSSVTQR